MPVISNLGPSFPATPPTFQLLCRTVGEASDSVDGLPLLTGGFSLLQPLVHRFLGQGGVVLPNANARLSQWTPQVSNSFPSSCAL